MNNQQYKSFVYLSKESVNYDYETTHLFKDGYALKARVDKYNTDTKLLISDLKNSNTPYKIINHKKRKRMIDIWVKKQTKNLNRNEFYTAQELADKLKVNIMTIYRYIKAGKIKTYKMGKEFRIDKKEFDSFLNRAKTR